MGSFYILNVKVNKMHLHLFNVGNGFFILDKINLHIHTYIQLYKCENLHRYTLSTKKRIQCLIFKDLQEYEYVASLKHVSEYHVLHVHRIKIYLKSCAQKRQRCSRSIEPVSSLCIWFSRRNSARNNFLYVVTLLIKYL